LDNEETRILELAEEPFQGRTQDSSRVLRGKYSGGKNKDQGCRPGQGGKPVAEKVLSSQESVLGQRIGSFRTEAVGFHLYSNR
jgi:hypothetical protein